jgi:hypothetical protein
MSWFRRKAANGPDYSAVASLEKASCLAEKGELVRMLLLPGMFGGEDSPRNVVFVPPFAADLKQRADENIVRSLAAEGKITRYNAEPSYSGSSFVPIAITVRASDPGEFSETIKIWGDRLAH